MSRVNITFLVELDAEELEAISLALSQRQTSQVEQVREWTDRAATKILNAKDEINKLKKVLS